MNILIINVPNQSIGSRLAHEHLPPLGLLAIAGPLIDSGHRVSLLDADFAPMSHAAIVEHAEESGADAILLGHSGSTTSQPVINAITRSIRDRLPKVTIIIGGVFPTYHWQEILRDNPQINYIVLGEGEQTVSKLIHGLAHKTPIRDLPGIAFQENGTPTRTAPAPLIENLDDYRVAWELMEDYHYTYWGNKKAVVIQFSRGCPYPCIYCGQSLFWQKWRHRSPQSLADEIEMLHTYYGVEVFNFADENPSSQQKPWIEFLEALVAKKLDIILVGSIRADNIVRDAEYLHLYKQAGFERFLLGIENYDKDILTTIKKSGTIAKDREAIQLLRQHDILSMATYVVGFGNESLGDLYHSLRHLLSYDPDQIQLLYATPHKWTPYYDTIKHQPIILANQEQWDYKHQVLRSRLPAWLGLLCIKGIEVILQTRPKAIRRLLFHRDARLRRAMKWYTVIGRRVWFHELFQFFFGKKQTVPPGMTVEDFWK